MEPAIAPNNAATNGARDFDFLTGNWIVQNRRLTHRLQACSTWESFSATSRCQPILGGAGNQDEFRSAHRPGFIGMSLRLFDPQSRQWSIYWVDNHSVVLQPPVVGEFNGDCGSFYGDDVFDGEAIRVRFVWSRIHSPNPRWEQAFSSDGGHSWETNWIMDFQACASDVTGQLNATCQESCHG